MSGKLYLCATPIGNLEDITLRVLRTLKEVDLIAAEDTRNSIKLLNHFDIKTPMTSYHEYNKIDKAYVLISKMQEGQNIALITDAGTPGISDPGEELAAMCYEAGIEVTSLPGPAACITALTLSGLPTRRFAFEAFLPADKKERKLILEELKNETRTIILYEAPHRLVRTLEELKETLGNRRMTLCRELTKRHETAFHTTIEELILYYQTEKPLGECVLVIEGRSRQEMEEKQKASWEKITIEEHMEIYENQGHSRKEAMKMVANDRGMTKKLSIIDFLDKENVTLKKKKGNAYWYLSPFRDEKTASFKVSKKENLWYDYAIKEGGDLVELVKRMYNKQSVSDALAYLASKSIATVDKAIETAIAAKEYTTTKMNDVKLLPLSNHSLLSYFSSRRIDITIGRMYCREIHYKVEQKHYYGIAFGNLSEGHEVRNPYFKGCIGHKDITLLAHTFNEWQNGCLVFEGFMDFLAYMTLVKQQDRWFVVESPCDYMILNSVANLKQALHYLDRYTHIHCFLDNDQAGRKTVESISNVFEYRVTDESFRYADYKDVNDYLMRKKRTASE